MEFAGILLAYTAASWVWKDSRKKKRYFPTDLVYLYVWLYLPVYLYETKGMKGILYLLGWILGLTLLSFLWVRIVWQIYWN
jgi:hypothetical protein